jgi:ribonuclease D
VALALARPERVDQIQDINGLKPFHARRYGHKILKAIAQGIKAEPPQPPPRPPRPPDAVLERYEALRAWRKEVAARRGVDSDVVISNAALWTLAQHSPCSLDQLAELGALGPWKQRTYGRVLLGVLRH